MKTILLLIAFSNFTAERFVTVSNKYLAVLTDTLPLQKDTSGKIFSKVEVYAQFPGGDKAWAKYMIKFIEKNIQALTDDNQSGTCQLRFMVDTDGNITNVNAISMRGSKLAEVAEQAIKKGPRWLPAIQGGLYVNSYKLQPVTFTITGKQR